MFPAKSILKRLLIFIVSYLLLMGLFQVPGLRNTSADLFSKGADRFVSVFLPKGYIHMRKVEEETTESQHLVQVMFGNRERVDEQMEAARKSGQVKTALDLLQFKIKLVEFYLMGLFFFLALLVITPVNWKRKLIGAGWGIILFLLFAFLKLLCYTLYYYTQFPMGVYELSGFPLKFVTAVFEYVKMGVNILLATLIWVFAVFRHSDWRNILGRMGY